MERFMLLFIAVLALSKTTWSSECPEGEGCICVETSIDRDLPKVVCFNAADNDISFEVNIRPREYVEIKCRDNSNWTEFHLGRNNPIKNVGSIYFERCNLPDAGLAAVTKQLLADDVSMLNFQSHMNIGTSLTRESLRGFKNLRKLALPNNNLENLPDDLLKDFVNLTILDLGNNNLDKLPATFFNKKLQVVFLGSNRLKKIDKNIFYGLGNLRDLSLSMNELDNLSGNIFDDTIEMLRLDLMSNRLSYLPDDVFQKLEKLVYLDLSFNRLTGVNEKLFAGLTSLEELRMNNNELKTIDTRAFSFTQNLKVASFAYNNLTLQSTLGSKSKIDSPKSPFHACKELKELDLSHNNVSNIFDDWKRSLKMKVLDLSYNQLQILRDVDLQFLSKDLLIDLKYNNLTHIDLAAVEIWAAEPSFIPHNVIISIANNPIRCDCQLYDLLRYLEGRLHPNVQNAFKFLMGGSNKCHSPSNFRDIDIADLRSETLKCDAKESGFDCPDMCDCYLRPENKAFLIDCAYKNLKEAPLKLSSSPNYHTELNLAGNYLTTMPSLHKNGYERVTILMLQHNNITNVTIDGLSEKLEVLNLSNNNITRLNQDVIDFLQNATTLHNLNLQANPWLCDCDALNFQKFIQFKSVSIPSLLKIQCYGQNSLVSEMTPDKLYCSETPFTIARYLPIALSGIIIVILAIIYHRCHRGIKIRFSSRRSHLCFVTENELNGEKLYDVSISYSHLDEIFVEKNIFRELEEGPKPYKIFNPTRNRLAGHQSSPKQIARAIRESRRTIILLSPNFIKNIWDKAEFRAAHRQALREGPTRVIVIIYGEIGPIENLEPELRTYLSSNKYLKWGDPWFWEKLKYELPHTSKFTKEIEKKIFEPTESIIHIENNVSNEIIKKLEASGIDWKNEIIGTPV